MMPRKLALVALLALGVATASACTPEEVQVWLGLPQDQQVAIVDALQKPEPTDCFSAMERVWPESLHGQARKIITRESGNNPSARNRSGASGCFQMMMPLHRPIFNGVGCGDPFDATCNSRAALALFNSSGWSPWSQTNY